MKVDIKREANHINIILKNIHGSDKKATHTSVGKSINQQIIKGFNK